MRFSARVVMSFWAITFAASAGAQTSTGNVQTDSSRASRMSLISLLPQDTAGTPITNAAPSVSRAPAGGASMTGLRAGVHLRETSRPSQPNAEATHANLGQARAMMIVGGAALIAGAIIGGTPGTIIMVGGAVIGLYGLYDYLQ